MDSIKEMQFGVANREQIQGLTGTEYLEGMMAGRFPAPPIAKVLQFRLVEIGKGTAIFTGVPVFDFYNPLGSVHGGYAATLLDSCMGCSIHTTLPAGMAYTPLEIKANFGRALTHDTGPIRAEAKGWTSGKR